MPQSDLTPGRKVAKEPKKSRGDFPACREIASRPSVRPLSVLGVTALLLFANILAATAQSRSAPHDTGVPIAIQWAPVPLNPEDPSQTTAGAFTYAGGLVLTSDATDRLHGLSDLAITGTDRITAVGDEGVIVTARLLLSPSGGLIGVTDGRLTILVGPDGQPLPSKAEADSEGLALFPNGDRLVSFERHHRIWLYPASGGPPREVPRPNVTFADANGGMEALAPDPDHGRDAYIVGAETTGQTWRCHMSGGCLPGAAVDRREGLALVAIRLLPGGRTAVLLRGSSAATGSRAMLRVLHGREVEAELELKRPLTVDNFEGVATVARPNGAIRFYVVSDDNASPRQRTLLLAFDWRRR